MNITSNILTKIKLLVVDDEKDITDLLVRHFMFLGYDITACNDPKTALKMIEEGAYNIVISDIVMPGMTGLELLRKIKEYNGGIHVVLMTGYVTMHHILTAMRLGAVTVFFKPLKELDQLEATIQECINKINHWRNILKELGNLGKAGRIND
ncbi:MAG: response regulator [Deltaproteobacteria bacterium]|nr:response regulator [Deltaproteobacteria bacterium]